MLYLRSSRPNRDLIFLEKGRTKLFVHPSIVFRLYTALKYRSSRSSNFLVFYTSVGILSKPVAFLFLTSISHTFSCSCVKCSRLMSNWLFNNFWHWFICNFGGFPVHILEMLFSHVYSFFLDASFILPLGVLFSLNASSTLWHAIRNCLSSIEALSLLI